MREWAEKMKTLLLGPEGFKVEIDGYHERLVVTDLDYEEDLTYAQEGDLGIAAIVSSSTIWVRDADVAQ